MAIESQLYNPGGVEYRVAPLPLPSLRDGGVFLEGDPARTEEDAKLAAALGDVARAALALHPLADAESAVLSHGFVSDEDRVVTKVEVAPGRYETRTRYFTSTAVTAPAAVKRGVKEGWVTEAGSPVFGESVPSIATRAVMPEDDVLADKSIAPLVVASRIADAEAARAAVDAAFDSAQQ